MQPRKRILFITTGTGVGPDLSKNESLAFGLYKSVSSKNPDKTIFFGSEKSKQTYQLILEKYKGDGRAIDNTTEFVLLDNPDDFIDVYRKMFKKLLEYNQDQQNNEIIIDYTSGTKTMSMAAAILGLLFKKTLIVVTGTRKDGIVQKGTESVQEQNLYLANDYVDLERAIQLFNSYYYIKAKEVFQSIISLRLNSELMSYLMALCDIFDAWDKFDRKKTIAEINQISSQQDHFDLLKNVKSFLNQPITSKNKKIKIQDSNKFKQIVELIHNAERRIFEAKYDDAVARLYRAAELIGQTVLSESYGLNSSDIDVNRIKELLKDRQDCSEFIKEYEREEQIAKQNNDKIKIGLFKNYELIQMLEGKKESSLESNKRFRDLIQRRNQSILAHGLEPVKKEDAEELFTIIKSKAEELWKNYDLSPNFSECVNLSSFPELDSKIVATKIFSQLF